MDKQNILPISEAVQILRRYQISPTQQRVVVAQALLCREQHLSADEVLEMVNKNGNRVSKATIYNTLGLFARRGLVRELVVDPNKIFYDSNTTAHHHYFNVETGELYDVDIPEAQLDCLPLPPEGTRMESVDIVIRVRKS